MKIRFAYETGGTFKKIYLPIIPPEFEEKFNDKIEYVTTINGKEKSIGKVAGARNITFNSYFPFSAEDPLAVGQFYTPDTYVKFFQEAEENKMPVKLSITGDTILDLFDLERWYYPHITWKYKAQSYDIWYTLTLKEYSPVKYDKVLATTNGKKKVISRPKEGFAIGDLVDCTGRYKISNQSLVTNGRGYSSISNTNKEQQFTNEECIIKNITKGNEYNVYVQSINDFNRFGWVSKTSLKHILE